MRGLWRETDPKSFKFHLITFKVHSVESNSNSNFAFESRLFYRSPQPSRRMAGKKDQISTDNW